MNDRAVKVAEQIVEVLLDEQRDEKGQFVDESILRSSAKAKLQYFINEGFLDEALPSPPP